MTACTAVVKAEVASKTRAPELLEATLVVMSMTSTGFAPAASQARTRAALTTFCPAERMRSWMACAAVLPFTDPMICSTCMRWKEANTEGARKVAAMNRRSAFMIFMMLGVSGRWCCFLDHR